MEPTPPQTPPGYPQPGPPQWPPPGAPYPYPPPKKGFPAWAIVLIVLVCLVPFCGIFGLAAIPLITSNTRDARRAEGEALLHSVKNRVLVAYAKSNAIPQTLTGKVESGGAGADFRDLQGVYFLVRDKVDVLGQNAGLTCDPVQSDSDGIGRLVFNVSGPDVNSDNVVRWE